MQGFSVFRSEATVGGRRRVPKGFEWWVPSNSRASSRTRTTGLYSRDTAREGESTNGRVRRSPSRVFLRFEDVGVLTLLCYTDQHCVHLQPDEHREPRDVEPDQEHYART